METGIKMARLRLMTRLCPPIEGGFGTNQENKKDFYMIRVQCYKFEKYAHFSNECWYNKYGKKGQKGGEEAQIAHGDDYDSFAALLMNITSEENYV